MSRALDGEVGSYVHFVIGTLSLCPLLLQFYGLPRTGELQGLKNSNSAMGSANSLGSFVWA